MEDPLLNFLVKFQSLVARNVVISHLGVENVNKICALDVAYKGNKGYAVAVYFDGQGYDHNVVIDEVKFPYIPTFLFIREAPLMIKALEKYQDQCQLTLIDGHGLAHPRKSGIATVIGVLLDIPTIGVAKSRLFGEEVKEDSEIYILAHGEKVGIKKGKFYFSIGNKVDLNDVKVLARKGYPEILKLADKLSKEAKGKNS
ncbi:endonuclease V [Stygiolobus caldivivus]|uniref:Endonuclease V n=1 Tax=Stygiolobus caldivivus TaxID=2824673 RepID=A0A8D5ZJC1_9CREN|nr:endonuclease V [Stygiolobus caldivivus]BCU70456.1 endonuclease V [Stygiolobus caldivivus]